MAWPIFYHCGTSGQFTTKFCYKTRGVVLQHLWEEPLREWGEQCSASCWRTWLLRARLRREHARQNVGFEFKPMYDTATPGTVDKFVPANHRKGRRRWIASSRRPWLGSWERLQTYPESSCCFSLTRHRLHGGWSRSTGHTNTIGWQPSCVKSPSGYMVKELWMKAVHHIIRNITAGRPRILFMDGHGSHWLKDSDLLQES